MIKCFVCGTYTAMLSHCSSCGMTRIGDGQHMWFSLKGQKKQFKFVREGWLLCAEKEVA